MIVGDKPIVLGDKDFFKNFYCFKILFHKRFMSKKRDSWEYYVEIDSDNHF